MGSPSSEETSFNHISWPVFQSSYLHSYLLQIHGGPLNAFSMYCSIHLCFDLKGTWDRVYGMFQIKVSNAIVYFYSQFENQNKRFFNSSNRQIIWENKTDTDLIPDRDI